MRPFFDLGGPPGLRIDMEASEGELAQGQIVEGGRSDRARPEHKGPPSACSPCALHWVSHGLSVVVGVTFCAAIF